jgi:PAS domain S-box-containing protein
MTTIDLKNDTQYSNKSPELILSLSITEEIIQFNKECEVFTGYQRDEVIHRKLSEILVPKESLEQWKIHFDSIQKTLCVDEFILPIKTKQDKTCVVSWNGILIRNTDGSIKNICLFGTPEKANIINTPTSPRIQMTASSAKEENIPRPIALTNQKTPKTVIPLQHDTKKILFARENETKDKPVCTSLPENLVNPLENIENDEEEISEKFDSMNKSFKELTKKYDTVVKKLGELEKKDRRLEKNHKNLGKHVRLLEEGTKRYTRKQKGISNNNISFTEQPFTNNEFTFFSDPFGFKKQHRELNIRKQQIEARTSQLNSFEKQLMNERKIFNARVEEFCRWREKLELLEAAIEKRRRELMEQEDASLNQSPVFIQKTVPSQPSSIKITPLSIPDSQELFNKISESAAIIQRGILKQVNTSFTSLLGYSQDEIVEKSYFDLIAQDGLADIERYYLDRLKGEDVTVYKTVFSTKDNNKLAVEVTIKQIIYNNEKAEIAIVKNLTNIKPPIKDELTLEKD